MNSRDIIKVATNGLSIYSFTAEALEKLMKAVVKERKWVGLTDEEQQELHDKWQKRMDGWGSFYQAVEQALKEKNSG